jgi:GTP-binding protein Era
LDNPNPDYKAGYVALVGRPNVGKSTLMNALLGQKVAAVSSKPQTTRLRQLGILTTPTCQLVFIDTPGIHQPVHKLGEYMNQVAEDALRDSDIIIWLVEAHVPPGEEDQRIAQRLRSIKQLPPVILALNKADLLSPEQLALREEDYANIFASQFLLSISAQNGSGLESLQDLVLAQIPVNPPFFNEDQITDFYERDIAAELIREAALLHLREEIPHGVAVRIDEFTERGDQGAYIHATLFVERESHKAIAIGKGGEMLKKIGSSARLEIENMSGRKIFLDLHVKVNKNWRNRPDALRWLGYARDKE